MCVCKDDKYTPSWHHRKPRALGGDDESWNISEVPRYRHRAWHALFDGTMTPDDIAEAINEVWLDPDFKLVVVRR